ncbi:MAG: tetratricopeptide repeat protein [Hyphomicrobiales bacterium]
MHLHWVYRYIRILVCLGIVGAFLAATPVRADQLTQLYQQILRNPQSVELNLRYAELAMQRGQRRKALAAYERVLSVDPSNETAQNGLRRITAALTPAITRGRVELGARWESNPRERPKGFGRKDDFAGFAKLYVTDERALLDRAWRSDVWVYADAHADFSSIDYWIARGHTGPLFDLGGGTTLHVAPGAGVAFLDADYYYAEAALKLTFEQVFGFLDKLEVRGAYRDIGNTFTPSHGYAIDVIAREAIRGVFTDADSFVIRPFFRWRDANNIDNVGFFGLPTTFLMGDYIEAGASLMYFVFVADDVRLGGRFTAYYRDYEQNVSSFTSSKEREDFLIAPEAELLFRDLICDSCDMRLRYRFEQNFSNDNTQDFSNHSIIASGIRRF